MIRVATRTLAILLLTDWLPTAIAENVEWKRIQLDSKFRAEGVAAADVNRDGKTDILAGDVWYEAPQWSAHELRPAGDYVFDGGYSQCFASFAYDINRDGWQDYIVVGMPGEPCYWYENPRGIDRHWNQHLILREASNESPQFGDLTGNGIPELVLGAESQLGFCPLPADAMSAERWEFVPVGVPGDPHTNGTFKYYHGLGRGDLNGDGRSDVVIPHGWHEAPVGRETEPWLFHAFVLTKDGENEPLRAADIHIYDLDLDGDQDIIMSSAHEFGIWWFENLGAPDQTKFKYHLIDESFSQTHALCLADINHDGHQDLITGKRFYAHNGSDPGGKEAVVMYWFEVNRRPGRPPTFTRHEIPAGRDTGIGTQFQVTDITGDSLLDIVLSNKKGVNVLVQQR